MPNCQHAALLIRYVHGGMVGPREEGPLSKYLEAQLGTDARRVLGNDRDEFMVRSMLLRSHLEMSIVGIHVG